MTSHRQLNFGSIPAILCLFVCTACGAAGSPIPPEDVGIEAKVREQRQKQLEQERQAERDLPIEEESVTLPPLRPIGTR